MTSKIISIDETTAQVTKAFQKQARIFGTEEYKLWKSYREDFPNATMTTKKIRKNPDKATYKNMTYKNMEAYIKTLENPAALLKEFNTVRAQSKIQPSPYRAVLDWFLQKLPDCDSRKQFFENSGSNNVVEIEVA